MEEVSFPYIAVWSDRFSVVHRPMLQVQLRNGTETFFPLALIDSGADATMMSADVADALGINLQLCPEIRVGGVGTAMGRICEVTFELPEFNVRKTITAVFVQELAFGVLLGQRDFFPEFIVRFEKYQNTFYLKRLG